MIGPLLDVFVVCTCAAVSTSVNSSKSVEHVKVFYDTSVVDSFEASNMVTDFSSAGWSASNGNLETFTSTDPADWNPPTTTAIVIPEQERGSILDVLSSGAQANLVDYVNRGGTLILANVGYEINGHADSTGYSEITSLNTLFGFDLQPGSSSCSGDIYTRNEASVSALPWMADAPSTLPDLSNTLAISTSENLPVGTVVLYSIGSCASAFVIPYGLGSIVSVGFDYYSTGSSWGGLLASLLPTIYPPPGPVGSDGMSRAPTCNLIIPMCGMHSMQIAFVV